jgi:hypothetical protein
MAHTPDGMKRFSRTIPTKRDGTCEYCATATRAGVDWAGVNGASGKWYSVCATCAQSITEQVKGVVRTIAALPPIEGADMSAIDMTVLPTILAGQATEAAAYDMLLTLMRVRIEMRAAQVAQVTAAPDPLIDGLRAIAASPKAQPRDREFAASLVAGFERYGSLTERQRSAGQRMWDRLNSVGPSDPYPLPELENGLYLNTATDTVVKLYNTQNDRQGCKHLVVYGDSGSFEYVKGGVKLAREAFAAGNLRALTEAEAQAFGKLHGFCVACALDIDDDRSLAVGYGPVCAKNYNWFYPSYAEAAMLLGRPVIASNGKVYEPRP